MRTVDSRKQFGQPRCNKSWINTWSGFREGKRKFTIPVFLKPRGDLRCPSSLQLRFKEIWVHSSLINDFLPVRYSEKGNRLILTPKVLAMTKPDDSTVLLTTQHLRSGTLMHWDCLWFEIEPHSRACSTLNPPLPLRSCTRSELRTNWDVLNRQKVQSNSSRKSLLNKGSLSVFV